MRPRPARKKLSRPVPEAQASSAQKKQDPSDAKKPPTPEHTGLHALFRNLGEDYKHLWSVDNAVAAAIGGGVALGLHPYDASFNTHLRSHYTLVNNIYAPAKSYGNTPEQVALSIGTYAFGRLFDKPKVAHLGMDLLQAQILSELLVEPIKFADAADSPRQQQPPLVSVRPSRR